MVSRILINRIKDKQFLKFFLKNWLLVFSCIAISTVLFVTLMYVITNQTLLKEMDYFSTRSLSNMKATADSVLKETCNDLINKVMHDDAEAFFYKKRIEPQNYNYIALVQRVKKELERNFHEFYYSVDIYSEIGNYIVTAFTGASSYERSLDQEIIDIFNELSMEMPSGSMSIVPRIVDNNGISTRILTIYLLKSTVPGRRCFEAVSIYTDNFIDYLSGNSDYEHGCQLLIDKKGRVLLDTSGTLYDREIELDNIEQEQGIGYMINDVPMRASWISLDWLDLICVQMVPIDEYLQSQLHLQRMAIWIIVSSLIVATLISYGVSCRLYRPIEAILKMIDSPSVDTNKDNRDDEIQYILVSILELFQKNTTLEEQMIERAISLRRARAKALQAQMTPHFLYNVLQTISWNALAETGSEDSKTSKSIMLLAELLNYGKEKNNNLSTVLEEIEYIKKYMQLASFRYGPGIHCEYSIDQRAEQMPIPCISLQTLVENSISHGIQPNGAKGNILISIKTDDDQNLYIRVDDDGVGFEQEKIDSIFEMLKTEYFYLGNHMGILNLFQRLRLIYGEGCQFKINNKENGGAYVDIFLPKLSEKWFGDQ